MADDGRPTRRRRRFGWTEPRWRDPAFWAAVAIAAVLIVAQAMLIGDQWTTFWWLSMALRALFTWILISTVIRIRVGIQRGLVGGFEESQQKAAAAPGGTTADNLAKASGRTVGRAIAAYKKSQANKP